MSSKEASVTVRLVTGASLTCLVCAHDLFLERPAQIRFASSRLFLFQGWQTAKCRVCARCGFVHWFQEPRRRLDERP